MLAGTSSSAGPGLLEDLGLGDRPAQLADHRKVDVLDEALAVDEDAVTVEMTSR